jgi:hypothetical protein
MNWKSVIYLLTELNGRRYHSLYDITYGSSLMLTGLSSPELLIGAMLARSLTVVMTFLLGFYVFRNSNHLFCVSCIQVGTLLLYPSLLIASSCSGIEYVIRSFLWLGKVYAYQSCIVILNISSLFLLILIKLLVVFVVYYSFVFKLSSLGPQF